ncbi:Glu-tRNA(Gln) amidotransferase subunit GatE [Promethearchaeum syntrophicum]|uniref:Glutamyl-tRNA(Gln) amidotransferase subunit E n=1 Tax=Promethearchaeum syntrophicum TaxID=2594042 RepID=A0A5B9D695_9ARCH|nr:Glu-tRNA(Gln) amidotransferase subunit GatE [Candidatus Prometheoarchaeum syntrophicum]QEE14525.1 Glutamyl-tRNA(Gln) amidotransferase subunit E [Candidatus Prometheoarchaeum syntrophicum]
MKTDFNYESLGLKIGLEIHQQLDSKKKLFCNCPNELQGTRAPDFTILRKQRPVLGEEGKFDKGMLVEFLKKGSIVYEGYYDCTCTYELDETPPFHYDEECLDITLEICALFKMEIIREAHVCRKNYVDGSVPAGFQRTMEIGQNGKLLLKTGKEIGIENIFLEEDAARRIKTEGKTSYFRVDRLGVPLNEITTAPEIHTPEEAKDAAYRIGLLLRSANKVKRVIGSTRQDINISIKGGERIEIKGVQKLDWIPLLVNFECQRQLSLIEIKKNLKKKNLKSSVIKKETKDLSKFFKNTPCRFVKKGIKNGQKLIAMKIPGFKGIYGKELNPKRRFGTEVAEKIKILTGLQGLIHSDEDLQGKYKFTEKEIKKIKAELKIEENDLFILLLAKGRPLDDALDIIIERTKQAFNGVPEETRRAQDDGTHIFLRELGGGKRLYPDTDTQSFIISEERIQKINQSIGAYPWDIIDEYSKKYKLSGELFENLIMTGKLQLFDKLIKILPDNPTLVIRTITDMLKVLHRENRNIKQLTEKHFSTLLKGLKKGVIAKEALESILRIWIDFPELTLEKAKKKAGITSFDLKNLDEIIQDIIDKNIDLIKTRGKGATGPLMGDVMKKIGRGVVDGKILSSKLQELMIPYLTNKKGGK